MTAECTNNKVFDLTGIAELPIEEAWEELVKTAKEAVGTRDLDDFRDVCSPSPPRQVGGCLEDWHRFPHPSMHQSHECTTADLSYVGSQGVQEGCWRSHVRRA